MVLKINEPMTLSMESLDMNYSMEKLHFEVMKEMVIANHRQYMNFGNTDIAIESSVSVFNKMGTYFKELIKKIKEFFSKVMMYVNAHLQDLDKFCKQYKDQLTKLNPKFTFDGYNFTIDDKLPVMDEFEKIVNDYNSCIMDVKSLSADEIKQQQVEFLKGENINALRGKVLGKNTPIQEDDFNEEVLKVFRGGSMDTQDIEVNSSYINNLVSSSKTLMEHKNKCEKDKALLLNLLNKTEAFFDKKVEVVYKDFSTKEIELNKISTNDKKFSTTDADNLKYDESSTKVLNALVKFKYEQVKVISGLINTVMVERLNAYKANIKQNGQILRQALMHKSEGGN